MSTTATKPVPDQVKQLYQKVEKIHLNKLFRNKYTFPKANDHAIVDAKGNILNFCSSSYNLRSNDSLYKPLEELMEKEKMKFDRKVNIVGGVKFYVDYIIRNKIGSPTVNDLLPKFSIWNSYDGTLKTTIKFGFYRLICTNGLTRPHGEEMNISKKHRISANAEEDMDISLVSNDKILEGIQTFLGDIKKDMAIFEKMNSKKADVNAILKISEKLNFSKKLITTAVERFNLETKTDKSHTYVNENGKLVKHDGSKMSMYSVYNALNYSIYNNNPKEFLEAKLKRDKLVLAEVLA